MLKELFPKLHRRYSALPILGPSLDEFAGFLLEIGFPRAVAKRRLVATKAISIKLVRRGCSRISRVTRDDLRSCAPPAKRSQDDIETAATVRLLERYLEWKKVFSAISPATPLEKKVAAYATYLQKVRGFAPSTIHSHSLTASQFLASIKKDENLKCLLNISHRDTENFIRVVGMRISRGSLQHVVGHLRSFLRFLANCGEAPTGLDGQIDTPRIYRGEQMPRALPWQIIQRLLQSIDRSTEMGLRDYTILLLITTYGLRASEIVTLKLEDIDWRNGVINIFQRKTASPLMLPLMKAIANSLIAYIRRGRPRVPFREVFVRHRAPSGILKPTAVSEIFQKWSRLSGLPIPFQGAHCLRHSYAVHLLRQGAPLKTIGDVLGHRDFESTCVYLRMAIEDLRGVPLNLPSVSSPRSQS